MEQIFPHFKSSKRPGSTYYDPADPESYESYLHARMDDATDYEQSILAQDRSAAQALFYGLSPGLSNQNVTQYVGEDPNATLGEILNRDNKDPATRSTYVSTDVRDAVMLVLPALIRLFGATESPVYLVPRSQQEVEQAEQGTDYVNYVFWNDNDGFLNLYGAFKDAMTVKTGFVKWWSEDNQERRRKKFQNITADQIKMLQSEEPSAKIVELGPVVPDQLPAPPPMPPALPMPMAPTPGAPPQGPMSGGTAPMLPAGPPPKPPKTYEYAVISYEVSKPLIKVAGVPPEEMRLDRYARNFRESRIVGHERIVPVDELIALGVDRQLCLDNIQSSISSNFSIEPQLRNPGRFMGSSVADGCLYGEWYVKIDKDNDDIPELRYICTIGSDRQIISDEEANRIKFALFSCDPIGHTIVGDSVANFVEDIQLIKTNMMRAILDSAAESINQKTYFNELVVDPDDVMGDDLGQVVRVRGDPNAAIMLSNTQFLGQAAMPVVEMINDQLSRRTGLTDAAKGLDPKALQSSTEIGVEAVINGAQERVELIARVLAETGFKDLFAGLYDEISENPNVKRMIKVRGKFVPVDTGTFDPSMGVEVNANLGKGSDMSRMIALQGIKQDQQLIVAQMGLANPICGIQEMLNVQTDILSLANVKNINRYFKTPNPQEMDAIMKAPPKPDPMAVAAQAQLEKARTESAKALAEQQFNSQKLTAEQSFKHEQLHTTTALGLEKLRIEGEKTGVERTTKMGALAGQLAKNDQDQRAADRDSQIKSAQMQNEQDAAQLDARTKQHDMMLKMIAQGMQHKQAGDQTQAQHSQAMTKLATDHHQAMTGHAVSAADSVIGAMAGDADRASGAQQADKDRTASAAEGDKNREHQAKTTAATLNTQTTIAKMKPKPKPKSKK